MVFFGSGDSKKERYHIEQSRIAIGSGGLAGKGFLNGTQNKFSFLPESRTDFIFAVICEEWGFLGALLIILLLYSALSQTFICYRHYKKLLCPTSRYGAHYPSGHLNYHKYVYGHGPYAHRWYSTAIYQLRSKQPLD